MNRILVTVALALGACGGGDPARVSEQRFAETTAATRVDLTVDWTIRTGTEVTRKNWGLNGFQAFNPGVAGKPGAAAYKTNVAYMNPGLLRYHNMGMMGDSSGGAGWVVAPTTAAYAWDRDKIARALDGAYAFATERMIDLANWPAFLDDGHGKLRTDAIDAYAAFCADLVRAVNVELGAGVHYWEVLNEKDPTYASDIGALATIYNRAAAAMRAVDPSIKVGGPGFLNPYRSDLVRAFVAATADSLDFFSYHSYSTGDRNSDNVGLLDNAAGLGWVTSAVVLPILAGESDHPIETYHDEWNISWNPPDERMTNIVSAVYDSIAMISLANGGVTGSAAWNESDGLQGKLSDVWGNWGLRPAAHVYHLFNENLTGTVVATSSSATREIVPFAVRGDTTGALVLVNRDGAAAHAAAISWAGLATAPAEGAVLHGWQVTATGLAEIEVPAAALATGYELPAYSVTVLRTDGGLSLAPLPPVVVPPPPVPNTSIARTATAPAIDGAIDAAWATATPLALDHLIGGVLASDTDLVATARALWDDAALYLLVDVVDDAVVADSANSWDDDGVELFVDADDSKSKTYGRNDFQYAFRWGAAAAAESKHAATAGVVMAQARTDAGYRIEVALPWSTLRGKPAVGALIGLDVHVNDDDDGGGRDSKRAWYGTKDDAWQSPAAFGNAELGALRGTGLRGQYFADRSFTTVALTRVDPQIAFDWGRGAPAEGLRTDRFSVRWTGSLVASTTGTHRLIVRSDDGVRLFVDGQPVLDEWNDHAAKTTSALVELTAGQAHALQLDYYENWGEAVVELRWQRPDGVEEVIPTSALLAP